MVKSEIILPFGYCERDILSAISDKLGIDKNEIISYRIVREGLDLSEKPNIKCKMSVAIEVDEEREAGLLKMRKRCAFYEHPVYTSPLYHAKVRPVVVGAGPAGLFAALTLAEAGANPIVIERGLPVIERTLAVDAFIKDGRLDPECNVQFGEGGAGTYSDGKLKVGSYDKYKIKVLEELASLGAPADVIYSATAHVGTDKLREVVIGMRKRIISLGGEFIFSARLFDIKIKDGRVNGVLYERGGERYEISTGCVILATGHSARDVYALLKSRGVPMERKGFGIGMRVEHPREYINDIVYGKGRSRELPTASYHLVTHLNSGRSVYSFCMCPGGSVVAATSEQGGIVTNGMSDFSRSADNSNSAILVSITPDDFASDDILAGLELQRSIEERAFSVAGGDYKAPSIRMEDFVSGKEPQDFGEVLPSYPCGTVLMRPEEYLPEYITNSIKAAMGDFDDWMGGFYHPDAVFTGPETRSTSPIRVLRGDNFEALGLKGLYPAGEGAGYAGGIVSSAVDGIKCAEALILSQNI